MNFHEIDLSSSQTIIPEITNLENHQALVQQNQNLLALLGDYWYDYYTDYETVKNLIGSVEALFSSQFKDIYKLILGSNVIDIPAENEVDFLVMVFDSSKANIIRNSDNSINHIKYFLDNFSTSYDKKKVKYITSNIINARLSLVEGTDYRIDTDKNIIIFYVDIFNDPAIVENCLHYKLEDKDVTLLWAVSNYIVSKDIASRFGYYNYSYPQQISSPEYKSVTAALQYFFVNQKSIKSISNALNILAGIPFSVTPREVVKSITIIDSIGELADPATQTINEDFADTQEEILDISLFYKVETDSNTYLVNYGIPLLVTTGQQLEPYQLLAALYDARDYLTTPDWYKNTRFPSKLLHSFTPEYYEESGLKEEYESKALVKHNGSFRFNAEKTAGSPFHLFKAVSPELNGNQVEVDLYHLIDNVLKYNLVSLRGDASYVTYEHFKVYFSRIFDLYEIIKPGFPVYLYPVFDFVISALFADIVQEANESQNIVVKYPIVDKEGANNNFGLGSCLRYDAEISHEVFYTFFHNTAGLYSGLKTYGEFDAYYYSCPSKGSLFNLSLAKLRFEEVAKVSGVPAGTYMDVLYNCGLRYNSLGAHGATLYDHRFQIEANIEDCLNGWVPEPIDPPEELVVQSLTYDGLGYHNYTVRYGFFDPSWLYYARLPLPDLDYLKHDNETVYAGVEDYQPFREIPYQVYDLDPIEGGTSSDSLVDSGYIEESLGETPGQDPSSPTYIQFYHDEVTHYNGRTKYGTSDESWNSFAPEFSADTIDLVIDDFFSFNVRDEQNHYTDIGYIPSDTPNEMIQKFSFAHEDQALIHYFKHDGAEAYSASPTAFFNGAYLYDGQAKPLLFDGPKYNSHIIKEEFKFTVFRLNSEDTANLSLDDTGGSLLTFRQQTGEGYVVHEDTDEHAWDTKFTPNVEIELNTSF